MQLPHEFSERVTRVWGKQGERWVTGFPDALSVCVHNWQLTDLNPYSNLSYNFITAAHTTSGQAVILKMGVPNPELTNEAAALQAYDGRGCVKLLAYDQERSALLLEQLTPGIELHALGDNREESEIAAHLMAQLCIPPPSSHQFPPLSAWIKVFDRIPDNYRSEDYALPLKMIETAQQLANRLNKTTSEVWLLHGDLHHFNILLDQRSGWTAIDPKGVIGDRAYQAARFFSNPIPGFLSLSNLHQRTRQRAEIIAAGLQQDSQRILEWAYVDCIMGACWSIEEGAPGVSHFTACAEIISQITGI